MLSFILFPNLIYKMTFVKKLLDVETGLSMWKATLTTELTKNRTGLQKVQVLLCCLHMF